MTIVIDADGCIMGRIASYAAKQALQGNEVAIVNCEKAFITGNRHSIFEKYIIMRQKGKHMKMKGPLFPTLPEKIMKRTIRGMLKYNEGRGKIAFKVIKCYSGVPGTYINIKKEIICKRNEEVKGIALAELSKFLRGGK
jgi:large subunit ribosomal protein L13